MVVFEYDKEVDAVYLLEIPDKRGRGKENYLPED